MRLNRRPRSRFAPAQRTAALDAAFERAAAEADIDPATADEKTRAALAADAMADVERQDDDEGDAAYDARRDEELLEDCPRAWRRDGSDDR